jgi:hypothetical protein
MAAVSDSPSPYAPGIIAEERLPTRRAGRAAVFLCATFVTTAVATLLWQSWFTSGLPPTTVRGAGNLFPLLVNLSSVPILLWAYLSDTVPLWRSRREGYVALASIALAAATVAVALSGRRVIWYAAAVPFGVATAFARAAILGALAEIGQRRSVTGALAGAHVGLKNLADLSVLAATPVMAVQSAFLLAGVSVGLVLALLLMIATLSGDGAPAPVPEPGRALRRFLRSGAFWSTFAVVACAGLATVPPSFLTQQLRAADTGVVANWSIEELRYVVTALAAFAYLAASRRFAFRTLLRVSLAFKAATLGLHAIASGSTDAPTLHGVLLIRAAGDGLAAAALLDLALRAAPRGREAFGAILLAGLPSVMSVFTTSLAFPLMGESLVGVIWLATGAAIAAVIAVSLVPKELSGRPRTAG